MLNTDEVPEVNTNADIRERIAAFIEYADKISKKYWDEAGYTFCPAPHHEADYMSDKWCRIWTVEVRDGKPKRSSSFAFVALQDNQTKALGKIKRGDIHKCATFKAPAKHARGNVFCEDFGNCVSPTCHINYL